MTAPTSVLRQFLQSSGVMALLYAGSIGLTFAVGVILARLLGSSGYGVYALAMTSATLVGIATEFGLPVLAIREVGAARASGNWGTVRGLIKWSDKTILSLSALVILGTMASYYLGFFGSGSDYLRTLLWAVLLIPFVGIGKLRSFALLAMGKTFASQFPVMILRPFLFLVGAALIWWLTGSLDPEGAMVAQVAGAAAVMLVMVMLFNRTRPAAYAISTPSYARREWISACFPMGLTEGLRLLQGQLGILIVGAIAGSAQAGIFRVADAVAQITAILASVVGTAATPMFARLWKSGDHEGLHKLAALAAWTMTGGCLAIGLPIYLWGEWLFPALFGAGFASSAPVFTVIWLGGLAAAPFGLCLALANMTGRHVLVTQAFAAIAITNLILGVWLTSDHGALGGAIASALANLVGASFCTFRLVRNSGLNPTLFGIHSIQLARQGLRMLGDRDRASNRSGNGVDGS